MKSFISNFFTLKKVPIFEALYIIFAFSDETKKSGRRLIGDVHFEEARKKASWITPVPGGRF